MPGEHDYADLTGKGTKDRAQGYVAYCQDCHYIDVMERNMPPSRCRGCRESAITVLRCFICPACRQQAIFQMRQPPKPAADLGCQDGTHRGALLTRKENKPLTQKLCLAGS